LIKASLGTRVVVLAHSFGVDGLIEIPVTLDGEEPSIWIGSTISPESLLDPDESYAELLSDHALSVLVTSWQVHAFDPVWGRNDLLWTVLGDGISGIQ
jgi:hypothetical protein